MHNMKPTYNNKLQHVKPQQQHTQLCLSKIFQSVIRKPVLETVWHRSTKLSLNQNGGNKSISRIFSDAYTSISFQTYVWQGFKKSLMTQQQQQQQQQ